MQRSDIHRRFFLPAMALAVCHLLLVSTAASQPTVNKDATHQELEQIRGRIEREEKRFALLRSKKAEIEVSLKKIVADYEKIAENRDDTTALIQRISDDIERVTKEAAETKQEIGRQREALRSRIIGIYKMYRRTGAVDYLFRASSATDLLKRTHFLAVISEHDKKKLNQMMVAVREYEEKEEALSRLKTQKDEQLRRITDLEKDLEDKKVKKAELLRDAEREAIALENSLAKLRGGAERLEKVLAGIMGSEDLTATPPATGREEKTAKLDLSSPAAIAPFNAPGLAALRGQLPLPVSGTVIQRYGKTQHEEFADILFVKGMEFKAPIGEKVTAVAKGKVVFNQMMPGYGNVVILDHGDRYYTLYGRLASSLCRMGDIVEKGSVIAVLGEADQKGRNFYFELRIRGKAVDPAGFFRQGRDRLTG